MHPEPVSVERLALQSFSALRIVNYLLNLVLDFRIKDGTWRSIFSYIIHETEAVRRKLSIQLRSGHGRVPSGSIVI
jgi:hypothetical protein